METKRWLPVILGIIVLVVLVLGIRYVIRRLASGEFPLSPPPAEEPPPPAPPPLDLTTLRDAPMSLAGQTGRLERAEVTSTVTGEAFWVRGVGNDRILTVLAETVTADPDRPPIVPGGYYTVEGQVLALNESNLPQLPTVRTASPAAADEEVFFRVTDILSADLPNAGAPTLDQSGEVPDPLPEPDY